VVTSCAQIGSASLVLNQDIRRDGTALARARVSVVLVTQAGKPQRLGQLVRGALQRFVNQRNET
jgi:acyl-CoA thioester hydrolase